MIKGVGGGYTLEIGDCQSEETGSRDGYSAREAYFQSKAAQLFFQSGNAATPRSVFRGIHAHHACTVTPRCISQLAASPSDEGGWASRDLQQQQQERMQQSEENQRLAEQQLAEWVNSENPTLDSLGTIVARSQHQQLQQSLRQHLFDLRSIDPKSCPPSDCRAVLLDSLSASLLQMPRVPPVLPRQQPEHAVGAAAAGENEIPTEGYVDGVYMSEAQLDAALEQKSQELQRQQQQIHKPLMQQLHQSALAQMERCKQVTVEDIESLSPTDLRECLIYRGLRCEGDLEVQRTRLRRALIDGVKPQTPDPEAAARFIAAVEEIQKPLMNPGDTASVMRRWMARAEVAAAVADPVSLNQLTKNCIVLWGGVFNLDANSSLRHLNKEDITELERETSRPIQQVTSDTHAPREPPVDATTGHVTEEITAESWKAKDSVKAAATVAAGALGQAPEEGGITSTPTEAANESGTTDEDSFSVFFRKNLEGVVWTAEELQQLQQMHREGQEEAMLQQRTQKELELVYPSKEDLLGESIPKVLDLRVDGETPLEEPITREDLFADLTDDEKKEKFLRAQKNGVLSESLESLAARFGFPLDFLGDALCRYPDETVGDLGHQYSVPFKQMEAICNELGFQLPFGPDTRLNKECYASLTQRLGKMQMQAATSHKPSG
ncbi:uncharacterized protein LOC34618152 [Cyclospora cayetanensis]|uniref:Uncharacterized protein LOC34618152 n=1 Tax=Cyclospora cayetanensis TaxID=88456 RepID=A0A6P6RX47_9EIME|nr:uncharacterized protein LOC34618152 [Cyclospora cayetanensis]